MPSRLRVSAVAEMQKTAEQALVQRAPSAATTARPAAQPAGTSFQAASGSDADTEEIQTVSLAFIVPNLRLDFGMHLRIVGGGNSLGDWATWGAPEMTWHEGDVWTTVVSLPPGDHSELVKTGGTGVNV